MHENALGDTLSSIATDAVPDGTDLWPGISHRLARGVRPARTRPGVRRLGVAVGAGLVVLVGLTLVRPLLPGLSATTQAADLARNDPEVASILRGDIAMVTVTSVVGEVATVVVADSHGKQVTVAVDIRSRIVTMVYQGPQLSADLTALALRVIRSDPRTGALLARGASVGRITPVFVSMTRANPTPGTPTQGGETWAQVPLQLGSDVWVATVDLPSGKVDQLLDPLGTVVPLP